MSDLQNEEVQSNELTQEQKESEIEMAWTLHSKAQRREWRSNYKMAEAQRGERL